MPRCLIHRPFAVRRSPIPPRPEFDASRADAVEDVGHERVLDQRGIFLRAPLERSSGLTIAARLAARGRPQDAGHCRVRIAALSRSRGSERVLSQREEDPQHAAGRRRAARQCPRQSRPLLPVVREEFLRLVEAPGLCRDLDRASVGDADAVRPGPRRPLSPAPRPSARSGASLSAREDSRRAARSGRGAERAGDARKQKRRLADASVLLRAGARVGDRRREPDRVTADGAVRAERRGEVVASACGRRPGVPRAAGGAARLGLLELE